MCLVDWFCLVLVLVFVFVSVFIFSDCCSMMEEYLNLLS